ncbi:hypothetical protein QUA70_22075 [Microcoleus sp. LAD1_D5]|uniref:hypothetical protein n=1 Tax=unclassified Microcoleus TaxID=2642155 RepID=UPI002FD238F1
MSFSGRLSNTDSQDSVFSRRDLLGNFAAIAVATTAAKRSPKLLAPKSYPLPEFKMGDLVAYDWEPDDDDAPEFATDFGEILGMRWVPEPDGHCLAANTWVYYIRWIYSTCPDILPEPCYDGEPTYSSDLRLVTHS